MRSSEAEYWTAAPPILSLYASFITDKKEAINPNMVSKYEGLTMLLQKTLCWKTLNF